MGKRSRKRDSWGSITEVERGKRYRIRYWAETPDGYRRKSVTVRGTRRDAERRRAELMLEHSDDAPCPTVGKVWAQWALPAYERRTEDGDLARQSLTQFKSAWNRHAGPRWADVPCDQVRPLDVQQWLDGMAYSSAVMSMSILKPAMDYAVRYGVVQSNPFREKYLMPSKSTVMERDKGVYTLDELGVVWRECALGQWWEAAFLAAAFGGLRVGESIGLRSEDITELTVNGILMCSVSVRRQILNGTREPTDRLKNPQSVRTIGIPGRAGERLCAIAREGVWLSGDGLGGPGNQATLNSSWEKATRGAAGVTHHPLRNLRNSFETNARWVLRLPPWIVEPMLGHKSEGVTGQYYDRPSADMLVSAMADAYASCQYDRTWTWTH